MIVVLEILYILNAFNMGHGGKRKGAGRPKSAPYSKHQINVDAELLKELKKLYGTKELNNKIRLFLASLRCV